MEVRRCIVVLACVLVLTNEFADGFIDPPLAKLEHKVELIELPIFLSAAPGSDSLVDAGQSASRMPSDLLALRSVVGYLSGRAREESKQED